MNITISRPVNGIRVNDDEYVLDDEYVTDETGRPLEFETVKEAIRFFAERNYTIADLLEMDFNIKEHRWAV